MSRTTNKTIWIGLLSLGLAACGQEMRGTSPEEALVSPAAAEVPGPPAPPAAVENDDLFEKVSPEEMEKLVLSDEIGVDRSEQPPTPPLEKELQEMGVTPQKDVVIRIYRVNPRKKFGLVKQEHMDVYYRGDRLYTWLVSAGCNCLKTPSSGKPYLAATRPGTFRIWTMSRYHRSTIFGNAKMHFALFFDGGRAIHATYGLNVKNLGNPASGGCVRLSEDHAEELWNLVAKEGAQDSVVVVSDVQDKKIMFPLSH